MGPKWRHNIYIYILGDCFSLFCLICIENVPFLCIFRQISLNLLLEYIYIYIYILTLRNRKTAYIYHPNQSILLNSNCDIKCVHQRKYSRRSGFREGVEQGERKIEGPLAVLLSLCWGPSAMCNLQWWDHVQLLIMTNTTWMLICIIWIF